MINSISQAIYSIHNKIPLFASTISAGFPSPADDYIENRLDLNALLIQHPSATFFVRVSGESMISAGIHHHDLLVVDRSLEPVVGKIVVAAIDGQLTVKRLEKNSKGKIYLVSANSAFAPIELKPEQEIYVWGVVTNVIHPL